MSFSFDRPEKDRAATRFMRRVHAALVHAAIRRKQQDGLTQRAVAARLGWDKATLSRLLAGRGNPTLRTLGEIAWALDLEPEIVFRDRAAGANEARAFPRASPPPEARFAPSPGSRVQSPPAADFAPARSSVRARAAWTPDAGRAA